MSEIEGPNVFMLDELKDFDREKVTKLFGAMCQKHDLEPRRITESNENLENNVFFVARHKNLSYPLVAVMGAGQLAKGLQESEEACMEEIGKMLLSSYEEKKEKEIYDQKAKSDAGKEQLTLVPRRIIHDICQVRMYGNKKYPDGGPDNWKKVEKERYRDAAFRHFLKYLDDPQGVDEESGIMHLHHLACNVAFLCEFEDAEREKHLKEAK